MRNCGVSFADGFKTPPPPNGGPLPLSGEAINRDFFHKICKD